MKFVGPVRFIFKGDLDRARSHLGEARKLIGTMEAINPSRYASLPERLPDGTFLKAINNDGQRMVVIDAPVTSAAAVTVEEECVCEIDYILDQGGTSNTVVNRGEEVDGTISGNGFFTGGYLQLSLNGHIIPNFQFTTEADLKIDMRWQPVAAINNILLLWNDQDNLDTANNFFASFQGGTGGFVGLTFGNPWGDKIQFLEDPLSPTVDWYGQFHDIVVELNSSTNSYTVTLDGTQIGSEAYDGNGFTANSNLRHMGRKTETFFGTRTARWQRYKWCSCLDPE